MLLVHREGAGSQEGRFLTSVGDRQKKGPDFYPAPFLHRKVRAIRGRLSPGPPYRGRARAPARSPGGLYPAARQLAAARGPAVSGLLGADCRPGDLRARPERSPHGAPYPAAGRLPAAGYSPERWTGAARGPAVSGLPGADCWRCAARPDCSTRDGPYPAAGDLPVSGGWPDPPRRAARGPAVSGPPGADCWTGAARGPVVSGPPGADCWRCAALCLAGGEPLSADYWRDPWPGAGRAAARGAAPRAGRAR